MAQNNVVGWFEIYVGDMERAMAFYKAVFQKDFEDMDDPTDKNLQMKSFPSDMTLYGAPGALVKMEGFSPGAGGTIVYFAVEDCANEGSRVVESGGVVIQPKQSLGEYGYMTLCKDTEGNVFGIHSML